MARIILGKSVISVPPVEKPGKDSRRVYLKVFDEDGVPKAVGVAAYEMLKPKKTVNATVIKNALNKLFFLNSSILKSFFEI
jgi:hypothetical protein